MINLGDKIIAGVAKQRQPLTEIPPQRPPQLNDHPFTPKTVKLHLL
jgi:hypothetical protein